MGALRIALLLYVLFVPVYLRNRFVSSALRIDTETLIYSCDRLAQLCLLCDIHCNSLSLIFMFSSVTLSEHELYREAAFFCFTLLVYLLRSIPFTRLKMEKYFLGLNSQTPYIIQPWLASAQTWLR